MNVVIIGAPRSGTNMLRDILTSLDSFTTWPCDEINYIWRHGNIFHPDDKFSASMANESVKNYIRNEFRKLRLATGAKVIVEKTCANSLRLPFVNEILPSAKYIFIVRDGFDVVGSARLRWTGGFNIRYLLAKAKYLPLSDLPFYSLRYLYSRLYRLFSHDKRSFTWGPIFPGMHADLRKCSLNEICALQWMHCVDSSSSFFKSFDSNRFIRVRYEDVVADPKSQVIKILNHLDLPYDLLDVDSAVKAVSRLSVGKGRDSLTTDERIHLGRLMRGSLNLQGYSE